MGLTSCALALLLGHVTDEAALGEAVRRFQSDYRRATSDDGRVAAVIALARTPHEKTAALLHPLLTGASVPVRIVAARELGTYSTVDGVGRGLLLALVDSRNAGTPRRGVRIEILRSLGALAVREATPVVDRLIEDKDVWVAKAAIDAAGKIRGRSSVEILIRALARIEGPKGNRGIGVDVYEGALPATTLLQIAGQAAAGEPKEQPATERDLLREPLLAALASIARVSHPTSREWQSWWKLAGRTFIVPK